MDISSLKALDPSIPPPQSSQAPTDLQSSELQVESSRPRQAVAICQFRSCLRSGSAEVLEAFQAAVPNEVSVCGTGCMGQCGSGPTVRVMPDATWYCRVQPQDVPQIVEQHLQGGEQVRALLHPRFHPRFDQYS